MLLLGATAGNAVLLASYGVGWHWLEMTVQSLLRVV